MLIKLNLVLQIQRNLMSMTMKVRHILICNHVMVILITCINLMLQLQKDLQKILLKVHAVLRYLMSTVLTWILITMLMHGAFFLLHTFPTMLSYYVIHASDDQCVHTLLCK